MSTSTVRVNQRTRAALTRISRERGISTAELLDEMVRRHQQDQMLREMNAAYARQGADADAAAAERDERAGWDATLVDGLGER